MVSCAAGVCDRHAPGPGNPGGVQGLVFNMSTDPPCVAAAAARACLDALLAWFRDATEARVINLNATGDGIALYRSLGFTEHHGNLLQPEQHADGFATQMIQTPSRQPLRQIIQRRSRNCAINLLRARQPRD